MLQRDALAGPRRQSRQAIEHDVQPFVSVDVDVEVEPGLPKAGKLRVKFSNKATSILYVLY